MPKSLAAKKAAKSVPASSVSPDAEAAAKRAHLEAMFEDLRLGAEKLSANAAVLRDRFS